MIKVYCGIIQPNSQPSTSTATGNVFPCVAAPAAIGEVASLRAEGVDRQTRSGFPQG